MPPLQEAAVKARQPNRTIRCSLLRLEITSGTNRRPASGGPNASPVAAALGAVVDIMMVTAELPLPEATCEGLKPHEVSAGRPEQVNVTVAGKFPGVGVPAVLKSHLFPPPPAPPRAGG